MSYALDEEIRRQQEEALLAQQQEEARMMVQQQQSTRLSSLLLPQLSAAAASATPSPIGYQDDLINRRQGQLDRQLQGTGTTGSWARGEGDRPVLSMTGAPRPATPVQEVNPQKQLRDEMISRMMQEATDPAKAPVAKAQLFKFLQDEAATQRQTRLDDATIAEKNAQTKKLLLPTNDMADYMAKEDAKTKIITERTKQAAGIPGTPEFKKQQTDLDNRMKAKEALRGHDEGADLLLQTINEIENAPGTNRSVGYFDAAAPAFSQEQKTAQTYIDNLLNKEAVSGLKSIRESGTAPGSITEREWPIFQSLHANLNASQDEKSFRKNLKALKDFTIGSKSRARANYVDRFGDAVPSGAPETPKVMTMQDVMDTAKSYGKTIDEVRADAVAKGFVIR